MKFNSIIDFADYFKNSKDSDFLNFKEKIKKIYYIELLETQIKIPDSFVNRVINYFNYFKKPVERLNEKEKNEILKTIQNQRIVKIFNKWNFQGSLFNNLRSMRPGVKSKLSDAKLKSIERINKDKENCDFCTVFKNTPEDLFGRIVGKYCTTAANIAKYDKYHSLLIFKKHNPFEITFDEFADYFNVSLIWFNKLDPDNKLFKMIIWNFLNKAGASKLHGHFQLLMSEKLYPIVNKNIEAMFNYYFKTNSLYFRDIDEIYRNIGLKVELNDVGLYFNLTPLKEKEITIIGNEIDKKFLEVLYSIFKFFINREMVLSFNFSLKILELKKLYEILINNFFKSDVIKFLNKLSSEYGEKIVIGSFVDRGNPENNISDFASMELFGASVISSDPFILINSYKNYVNF